MECVHGKMLESTQIAYPSNLKDLAHKHHSVIPALDFALLNPGPQVTRHTPTDMATALPDSIESAAPPKSAELDFLDSIMATFKHKFTGREFLDPDEDGKPCAGSAGEKSLVLPTGAVNIKIERSGDTTNVSAPGAEFTLRKLKTGPDRSTNWRYELIVRDSIHCYIDECEATWLRNWALPMAKFQMYVNLLRPKGVPPRPSNQVWLKGDVTPVCEKRPVYKGKNRDNPAYGTEVEEACYYPIEQVVVYTREQCCGEYPCRCADVCKNTVRIVRLTRTGQEILLDWVAYDPKSGGSFIRTR